MNKSKWERLAMRAAVAGPRLGVILTPEQEKKLRETGRLVLVDDFKKDSK